MNQLFEAKNINLLLEFFQVINVITPQESRHSLHIDKNLNQIILPNSKLDIIINWWNETIRFEKTVPETFGEGYLILNNKLNKYTIDRSLIRSIAQYFNQPIYEIKGKFLEFITKEYNITIYFKFVNENVIIVKTYDTNNELFSSIKIELGDTFNYEQKIENTSMDINKLKTSLINDINYFNVKILITVLWYIAISGNKTKYVYQVKRPKIEKRTKREVKVSDTKTITSSIYDFNQVRIKNITSLNKRKEGWTYSHSFMVHGHYRHYKDGKVIFINEFKKGANKDFKSQKIILNPKNETG